MMGAAWHRGSVRASHAAALGSKHSLDFWQKRFSLDVILLSLYCLVCGQY